MSTESDAEKRTLSLDAATVLLHQYSEWFDRIDPLPEDLTHDDCVALFLSERSPDALPALVAPCNGCPGAEYCDNPDCPRYTTDGG